MSPPNVDVDVSPFICQLLLEFWQSSTRYNNDDDDSGTSSTSTNITDDYDDRNDQSSTPTLSVLLSPTTITVSPQPSL